MTKFLVLKSVVLSNEEYDKMIKNAAKIDYDIKSVPLSEKETERLTKIIADYKKKKVVKKAKKRCSSLKRVPA